MPVYTNKSIILETDKKTEFDTKRLDNLERQTTELLDIVSDNASHEDLERYWEIAKELFNGYSPTAREQDDKDIRFEIYTILGAIYNYFAEILEY